MELENPEDVPAAYLKELKKQGYQVAAEILERRASRRWEASGFDHSWWKYPDDVWTADSRQLLVVKLSPDWRELKELISEAHAGRDERWQEVKQLVQEARAGRVKSVGGLRLPESPDLDGQKKPAVAQGVELLKEEKR